MPDILDDPKPAQSNNSEPQSEPVEAPGERKSDPSDTLPVPPPNFRERLQAAQRARANEIRPSVEIPIPGERPPNLSEAFDLLDETKPSAADVLNAPAPSIPADSTPDVRSEPGSLNAPPAK